MKEIIEIIKRIWELPWYQIMAIAMIDDALVFLKIWPVWIGIIILVIVIKIFADR